MHLDIYKVDAFTALPFKGNPAGVCITQEPLKKSLMLSIAKEVGASETAFLTLKDMTLRWFTPRVEVDLCGHATLATAHILKNLGVLKEGGSVEFQTRSGTLSVRADEQELRLNFPEPKLDQQHECNLLLLHALGLSPSHLTQSFTYEGRDLLVLDEPRLLLDLTPNFEQLKQLPGRGVVVTALGEHSSADFISRYFAPWVGVNEDPVTGSAHCALAAYWCRELGKTTLCGYQASSRGGFVSVSLKEHERVEISGHAVTMVEGAISI